jgi:hypothetical protein
VTPEPGLSAAERARLRARADAGTADWVDAGALVAEVERLRAVIARAAEQLTAAAAASRAPRAVLARVRETLRAGLPP